jgi:hypothetical protein
MITLRQIERLWDARDYSRMLNLLMDMRPETSLRATLELARPTPVAAMAIIRLDELNQSHAPFCSRMIRVILAAQDPDGGFGDPMTTALCLRALMCCRGLGPAIDHALQYLAALQRPEGLWPKEPLRRMPPDPYVSAFVLHQLADDHRFAQTIQTDGALAWFSAHQGTLDPETARLYRSFSLRRGLQRCRSLASLTSTLS